MGVNLLGLMLVQRDEAVEDVVASSSVVWAALVVGEVVLHWADGELLLEAINLVEEQDDGCMTNHRELQMESNSVRASFIRLTVSSSNSSWSYSEMATRKRMVVTFSKQCIHFFRSDR